MKTEKIASIERKMEALIDEMSKLPTTTTGPTKVLTYSKGEEGKQWGMTFAGVPARWALYKVYEAYCDGKSITKCLNEIAAHTRSGHLYPISIDGYNVVISKEILRKGKNIQKELITFLDIDSYEEGMY